MIRTIRLLLVGAMVAASCAATAQTLRVRGTIEKAEGNVLTLKSSDGAELRLTLTDDARIVAVVKASMADIKEGTFLGSAAMPQPDGSQKALEVHIFAASMRGQGEGHRPWDGAPNSTMTNGAVGNVVSGVDGPVVLIKYRDGEKKIIVGDNIPIVRYEVGDKADLKAGAAFTITAAAKQPDGSFTAARINVGRDGGVPN